MECNPKLECDFKHIVTSNFHFTAKTAFAPELALNFITYNTSRRTYPVNFFWFPTFLNINGSAKEYTSAHISYYTIVRIHSLIPNTKTMKDPAMPSFPHTNFVCFFSHGCVNIPSVHNTDHLHKDTSKTHADDSGSEHLSCADVVWYFEEKGGGH